jgi:undecaprenyl-diphosphatase
MSIFQAIILGIVQGISEFLPISSSAHLVLVPMLFHWQIPQDQIFPFNVLVQMGTLVAVILYFWQDLLRMIKAFFAGLKSRQLFADPDSRLAWWIILATIPAGVIGLLLEDVVEAAFQSPVASALFLLVTAVMMWLAEHFSKKERSLDQITWLDALLIGFGQALAIFPGISRSGATISVGLFRNIKREAAGRFSFLMSIPIMLAAGLLGFKDLLAVEDLSRFLPVMAIGFVTAGLVGYIAIRWLLKVLQTQSLKMFSYYCVGFAAICLIFYYAF